MRKIELVPILLESVGIATIGVGIGIELATEGGIGHLLITSGSCLIAIGALYWAKLLRRA